MKHFYLIANPSKQGTRQAAEQIMDYLRARGAFCEGHAQKMRREAAVYGYTDKSWVPSQTQCVITLGGDGTLIQAARDLVDLQIPLIGVNMGNLGYLTQVAQGERLTPMLDALLEDRFRLERRMMLAGTVCKQDTADVGKAAFSREQEVGIALNDIVLTRKDVMILQGRMKEMTRSVMTPLLSAFRIPIFFIMVPAATSRNIMHCNVQRLLMSIMPIPSICLSILPLLWKKSNVK